MTDAKDYCKGFTKKGTCCTRMVGVKDNSGLCKVHKDMVLEECSICLDKMFVKQDLTCGHSFCKNCIYKWDGETCPMCRKDMPFITHNKDTIFANLQKNISLIDECIENRTVSQLENTLNEVVDTMLKNVWIQYYERAYIDMLMEFIEIGLKMKESVFKSYSKVLDSLMSRPYTVRMCACECGHHHEDDTDEDTDEDDDGEDDVNDVGVVENV